MYYIAFEFHDLCGLPLPRAIYLPVPEASISVPVLDWYHEPQSKVRPCMCPPPAPASRLQCKSLLHPQAPGRKQACCLWCLSTNLSPTSLGSGPLLLLCMASFFPRAAPAGLWPGIGITCSGLSLWHYSQGCGYSPLPSFSDAKVCSLMDFFPPMRLVQADPPLPQGFHKPSQRPISSHFQKNSGAPLCI